MDIRDRLHLTQVKRYPICHTNKDQTVAEHSYGVAIVALALADAWKGTLTVDYTQLLAYSLLHDVDEVFTGDIPSPFKAKLRRECPDSIRVLDHAEMEWASPTIKYIVKTADYIEALYFLAEYGGSRRARAVEQDIRDKFLRHLDNCELGDHFADIAKEFMHSVVAYRHEDMTR